MPQSYSAPPEDLDLSSFHEMAQSHVIDQIPVNQLTKSPHDQLWVGQLDVPVPLTFPDDWFSDSRARSVARSAPNLNHAPFGAASEYSSSVVSDSAYVSNTTAGYDISAMPPPYSHKKRKIENDADSLLSVAGSTSNTRPAVHRSAISESTLSVPQRKAKTKSKALMSLCPHCTEKPFRPRNLSEAK